MFRKKAWEEPHLEYAELAADDPNFPEPGSATGEEDGVYRVSVEKSEEALIIQLRQLGEELRRRVATHDMQLRGAKAALEVVAFRHNQALDLIVAVRGFRSWPAVIALPQSPHACTLDLASAECLAARLLCLQCLAVPAHALLERLRHALARTEAPALQVWSGGLLPHF